MQRRTELIHTSVFSDTTVKREPGLMFEMALFIDL
jgi:hypothetical protein